jgi:hypothetical protein
MVNLCKITVFLSLFVFSSSIRIKRREGDQAPPGQCATYRWGGISGLHWYACCNNCNQGVSTCDGVTYQSATSTAYCAKCGIDTKKGDGTSHATYPCGGCQGQERTRKKCLSNIRSVFQIPGLCWAFAKCFKSKCESVAQPETCFNLVCDAGETVDNCPTDCCGSKNEKCDWSKSTTCVPQCCNEHTCCDTSGSDVPLSFGINCFCIFNILISVIIKI